MNPKVQHTRQQTHQETVRQEQAKEPPEAPQKHAPTRVPRARSRRAKEHRQEGTQAEHLSRPRTQHRGENSGHIDQILSPCSHSLLPRKKCSSELRVSPHGPLEATNTLVLPLHSPTSDQQTRNTWCSNGPHSLSHPKRRHGSLECTPANPMREAPTTTSPTADYGQQAQQPGGKNSGLTHDTQCTHHTESAQSSYQPPPPASVPINLNLKHAIVELPGS